MQVDCKRKETGLSIFKKNVSDVDAVIAGQAVKSNTEYIISITPETSQGFKLLRILQNLLDFYLMIEKFGKASLLTM